MNDSIEDSHEASKIRLLWRLVLTLTIVMIIGITSITILLAARLLQSEPALPDHISLPKGVSATNFTIGSDWLGVVTRDDRLLIFDRDTGKLRQSLTIE
ncbi:MAG: DUF6476 family protein [Aestuariivita sp.]|nr:DUF6476 family protein [Aestuariivita sp.]MCY4203265.1 DUF6476 family protein [Aestuariivita sp.]MCY4287208.1 DUF6476 family protein [Aestuariivita sp.]MCY4347484.1 DUF6476 family protein [Aestuariivita sp.]